MEFALARGGCARQLMVDRRGLPGHRGRGRLRRLRATAWRAPAAPAASGRYQHICECEGRGANTQL